MKEKQRVRFSYNGKRCEFILSGVRKSYAAEVKRRILQMISRELTGEPNIQLDRWIAGISEQLRTKLCRIGLLQNKAKCLLRDVLDKYIKYSSLSRSTIRIKANAVDIFYMYFGDNKDIRTITDTEVLDFRNALPGIRIANHKSMQTCVTQYKAISGLMTFAVKLRLITRNPFRDFPFSAPAPIDKKRFITKEDTWKIINACRTTQFKAVFAAARFIGIRIPSELFPIRWSDITWSTPGKIATIKIIDSKRKNIGDKGTRVSPLFPEAEKIFKELFLETKPKPDDLIFTNLSRTKVGNTAIATVKRSGVPLYPKVFHSLRASLETEYHRAGIDPIVYTRWIGNSPAIAIKHYVQYAEEDFNKGVLQFKDFDSTI